MRARIPVSARTARLELERDASRRTKPSDVDRAASRGRHCCPRSAAADDLQEGWGGARRAVPRRARRRPWRTPADSVQQKARTGVRWAARARAAAVLLSAPDSCCALRAANCSRAKAQSHAEGCGPAGSTRRARAESAQWEGAGTRMGRQATGARALPCYSRLGAPAAHRGPKAASRAVAQNNAEENGPA